MSGDPQLSLFSDVPQGNVGDELGTQVTHTKPPELSNVVSLGSFVRKASEPRPASSRAELLQRVLDRTRNF